MDNSSELCIDCRRTDKPSYQNVKIQTIEKTPDAPAPAALASCETQTTSIDEEIVDSGGSESGRKDAADLPADENGKENNEMHRRLHPNSNADFDLLHSELQQWRDSEQDKIHATLGGNQIELEQETLAKEGYLLRKIDKLKADIHKERRTKRIDDMLCGMASPKRWLLKASGDEIVVHTPASSKASTLRKLYNGLAGDIQDNEGRKKYLVETKDVVSKFQTSLAKDLSELIDREIDLIDRQLDHKVIDSLNIRVRNLLLQFIQDPRHNEASIPVEAFAQPMVKFTSTAKAKSKAGDE